MLNNKLKTSEKNKKKLQRPKSAVRNWKGETKREPNIEKDRTKLEQLNLRPSVLLRKTKSKLRRIKLMLQ